MEVNYPSFHSVPFHFLGEHENNLDPLHLKLEYANFFGMAVISTYAHLVAR